ncbi:MAG: four-carbon acid sugar kinase family protein, partial [Chromatiales bacterium]|nr:four-carbon acid sugar kinase family protein [Chromatiales bacterium]
MSVAQDLLLGCIADDFTGATDLANTLVKEGMRVVQVLGLPDGDLQLPEADCVVVALKSRTIAAAEAAEQSLGALHWLQARGVRQVFFKYCSTFDSTDDGNIGPVTDALMDALGESLTIACPAFPTAGRTLYKGHLFVGDELLSDSSMKDHPLTPMTDANLVRVLGRQTKHPVGLLSRAQVAAGPDAAARGLEALKASGHRYVVTDAIDDTDLRTVGTATANLKLVTGGSGIALGLPDNFRRQGLLDAKA